MRLARGLVISVLCATAPAQDWLEVFSPARTSATLAYDSVRGRLVRHALLTWEWNGAVWTRRAPSSMPSPGPIAFDAARRRTILFDGMTWAWDGVEWTRLSPRTSPSQYGFRMAYDPVRECIVMYTGYPTAFGTYASETWEWDGAEWRNVLSSSGQMPPREGAAMAFDPVRQRVVLFGGMGGVPLIGIETFYNDLWEWDGTDWQPISTPSGPAFRRGHALATDPARGRVVLFGGYSSSYPGESDTWEWDGMTWTERLPSASPAARNGHAMAFDAGRNEVVLFGGSNSDFDTWAWDGTNWTQLDIGAGTPFPCTGCRLSYDSDRDRAVLYGDYNAKTWEWDGQRWRLFVPATSPPSSEQNAMAYDEVRRRTVYFEGSSFPAPSTWEWDGTDWVQRATSVQPRSPDSFGMVFDSARQRMLLVGMSNGGFKTWEWDGMHWTQRVPANSPAGGAYSLAYDRARQCAVLFGGPGGRGGDQTWEWDGSNWTQREPVVRPAARFGHRLVYHEQRGRVVLFGGGDVTTAFSDTWEWDGSEWSLIAPERNPSARSWFGIAYDNKREQLVMFGGQQQASGPRIGLGDTWIYGLISAAAALPYGAGCKGGAGAPVLGSLGLPRIGSSGFALDLLYGPPSSPTAFLLATNQGSVPLGGGCSFLLDPLGPLLTVGVATNGGGFATAPLPLPHLPQLRGGTLFAQAVSADAAAPIGLVFTGGLRLLIGE